MTYLQNIRTIIRAVFYFATPTSDLSGRVDGTVTIAHPPFLPSFPGNYTCGVYLGRV
jgi:hypothetical protein